MTSAASGFINTDIPLDRWLSGPKHAPAKRKSRRFESDSVLQLPLNSLYHWYYLYGMREQFEITTTSDLTEVRDSERVSYSLNDGDTILTLATNDPNTVEKRSVSKYRNASVKITITVEHDDMEYKDIQPE